MADKKPSVFRFRLPWLLQPALATPPASTPEPPRTTTVQTSVASTSASRPPFRPPGRAPAPVTPPTTIPTSRLPPQSAPSPVSVESPPPPPPPPRPPVEAKPPVPKSPIAKTLDPVATRSTKETQNATGGAPTIETTGPATPPQKPPSFRPRSPPQPSSPAKPDSQPSSPSRRGTQFRDTSPPVSPSRMPTPPRTDSKPLSPSRLATQPRVPTNPSSPAGEASKSRPISQPTSPVHVQPPPPPPPPPPAPTMTTSAVQDASVNHGAQPRLSKSIPDTTPEIKSSNHTTHEKFSVHTYHVPLGDDLDIDAKSKEMTELKGPQTKSMNSHSMEAKRKPKPMTSTQAPLHKEIKNDISKFIHKVATSSSKQSMDEKPGSIITLAGDNKGASMHLGSDPNKREAPINIQRSYKLDSAINGEGTSNGEKSQKDSRSSEDQETKAIVNSNIQGINNSIMFNSSVTERNPGVHLAFSRTLANMDSKIENTEPMEIYKAEADISPSETVVYDPTIERSLGGFFMESMDSEPDDPEMFAKEYEIEVL
ncbi:hypothetical protein L1887_11450 [Cichorium endivia]|nr:hypothetical protein L1887_11450 [Cichorium endivia]